MSQTNHQNKLFNLLTHYKHLLKETNLMKNHQLSFKAIFLAITMLICIHIKTIHAKQNTEKDYENHTLEPSKSSNITNQEEQKKIFELVKKSLHGMMEPVEIFNGPGNIKGVLVKHPRREDNQFAVWVVDNKYVLVGDITDSSGKAVSRIAYLDQVLSKSITQEAIAELQGIALNSGKRPIYVLADPNCEFCNKLYHMIQKTSLEKFTMAELKILWVPVAFINKDTSTRKAIAILKGGVEALKKNETKFQSGSGAIKGLEQETNMEEALAVQRNTKTLKKFDEGRGAMTPTIIWTDTAGALRVQIGTPSTLDIFFE